MDNVAKLRDEINDWVDRVLPKDYPSYFPTDNKLIREAVLGYHLLKPHEYIILDSPIVQRLRYIHQTALTYLIYPTATHTRFDHSLGVARIAERIGDMIGLEKSQICELRLAAILHDVGHCFFSHISEGLIKTRFKETFLQIKEDPLFADSKTHEILSYFIVSSPNFTYFLQKILDYYKIDIDVNRISRLIIGKPEDPKRFAQMGDIINGPFDSDKLDYLVRDCYFTGIRADIDVDRVVICSRKLDVSVFTGYPNANLIMTSTGVSNLEQVTLNKILLFSAIYHHHKVRATECMVKSIFEIIWSDTSKIKNEQLRFNKITDFFNLDEFHLLSMGMYEEAISPLINRLLKRDLLKRSLIIAPKFIESSDTYDQHDIFKLGEEFPEQIDDLREFIWEEIPKSDRTSYHDLWVDLPEPPNVDADVDRCWIDLGNKKDLKRLRDFLPYGEWLDAYEANKLQGHVFYTNDNSCRNSANKAARTVFTELYGIKFNPSATDNCKYTTSN